MQEIMEFVGKKIAVAIKESDLSQLDIAQDLSVSNQLVSHWINGRRPVSLADLIRISKLTGKTLRWFYPKSDLSSSHTFGFACGNSGCRPLDK